MEKSKHLCDTCRLASKRHRHEPLCYSEKNMPKTEWAVEGAGVVQCSKYQAEKWV